ncbi:patched domain-containing protein 3-like [Saccostrea echinata]|uniref:patched domain-containing protein 3-like n=1 Tax=Saccostrea echinata TaxID=191078 RepID=UPI002A7F1B10|nr:patched domain-containing protein 3-like [Saccostrea echinata]
MEKCKSFYEKHEGCVGGAFEKFGGFVSRHPIKILIICIVVNLALLIGIKNLSVENDIEILYTPENSQAFKDRDFLKNVYSDPTTSNFQSYQLATYGRYADIMIISRDKLNIMNQTFIDEMNNVDRYIQTSINFTDVSGLSYKYPEICALDNTGCHIRGSTILKANFQKEFVSGNVSFPYFNSHLISSHFAKAEDKDGKLVSTIGVKLRYYLRQNTSVSKKWERTYLKCISQLKTNNTDIAFATSDSLGRELNKNVNGDVKYFIITFTLMMTYACLASGSSKLNNIGNRANLGIAGVITPVLGIGSALGFLSAVGVKFTSIVGVMPFLIVGIGIDDMFILMSGMADAPPLKTASVEKRMEYMLKKSGITITITSITDLLAFLIGATSVFISIRNFCIYTGVAVLFCYLNQLFFFSPAICLNEIRTKQKRHYCLCCLKLNSEETDGDEQKKNCSSGSIPEKREDVESFLEKYPKQIAIKLLSYSAGKIAICISFAIYLSLSIYGTVNFEQGLSTFNLVAEDSYFHKYSKWEEEYFRADPPITLCIKQEENYSLKSTQNIIMNILAKAKKCSGIDGNFEINWLKQYQLSPFYSNKSESQFVNGLRTFLSYAKIFSNDIVFDASGTKILSSKFYLKAKDLKTTDSRGSLMLQLRAISKNGRISCFFYAPAFIFYEQYVQIMPSTLKTVGIAIVAMLVVTSLLMPKPIIVIIVALNLISILLGVVGFMYYWNLTLSSITMIHLVMSVGFSVDFSVHVSHAFLSVRLEEDVIKKALDKSGGPVINAALSSLLGISMLAFSNSYVFVSFGKVMFLVVIIGLLHAVFFLPLVLYIITISGSKTQHSSKKVDEMECEAFKKNEKV